MLNRIAMLVLLLAGVATVDARADSHHAIERACTDLVLDYAYHRDRPDADGVAGIFAEDAVLSVLGQDFVGRDAIRARLQGAENGPVFRHMMSTVRIFVESDDRASGVSYVTVYSAPPGGLPRPLDAPLGVGEYHDKFVRTAAGWKIQRREFIPVFMPEN